MENPEKDRLIGKLFNVVLKEIFSPLYRKYDEQILFEVWAEIVTTSGLDVDLNKWRWKPEMTITEVIDSLDCYRDSIEVMVQQRQAEKEKKKGKLI